MPGGDFIFAIVVVVLGLLGAGELLIRAVEGLIAGDPYSTAHGDVPHQPGADELEDLRRKGAL